MKHPSYGAGHTYIHTDKVTWLFFLRMRLLASPFGLAISRRTGDVRPCGSNNRAEILNICLLVARTGILATSSAIFVKSKVQQSSIFHKMTPNTIDFSSLPMGRDSSLSMDVFPAWSRVLVTAGSFVTHFVSFMQAPLKALIIRFMILVASFVESYPARRSSM